VIIYAMTIDNLIYLKVNITKPTLIVYSPPEPYRLVSSNEGEQNNPKHCSKLGVVIANSGNRLRVTEGKSYNIYGLSYFLASNGNLVISNTTS